MITNTMKKLNAITGGELTFGKAVKALRLSEDMKQGEFAKKLSVTQSYLSDIEHDRKEISLKKAAEIAKILQQSEKQFIRLAIQDALRKKGFRYMIEMHEAA